MITGSAPATAVPTHPGPRPQPVGLGVVGRSDQRSRRHRRRRRRSCPRGAHGRCGRPAGRPAGTSRRTCARSRGRRPDPIVGERGLQLRPAPRAWCRAGELVDGQRERSVGVVDRDRRCGRSRRRRRALAARSWLRTANASTSRAAEALERGDQVGRDALRHRRVALRAARGCRRRASDGASAAGQRDIDSTPQPMASSCSPLRTPIAAKVTACWPEPQNRFSVTPGISIGQPAASTDSRPIDSPWSPTPDRRCRR